MSSIYFIVDNQLPERMQIYLRGKFPNVHNNFGGFEDVGARTRKELSHHDGRDWASITFGYQAQIKVWGKNQYSEAFFNMLVMNAEGHWDGGTHIDLSTFRHAKSGDINVVLTAKSMDDNHLTLDVSHGMR
jgi:hypothetical protein